MDLTKKELLERCLEILNSRGEIGTKKKFHPSQYCFDKQLAFITDASKRKVACNSRRSGKTVTCAAHLIYIASTQAGVNCLYITLSRLNAKRIIWRELCDLNKIFDLGAKENLTELSLEFPNGSRIYLAGASDEAEIEKFRGMALKLVYIDEAQAFKAYLERLIHEVLTPALYDYDGELCLIGTPPPVCAGVFFDAYHGKIGYKGFKAFHWTIFDNPHIAAKAGKSVEELIESDLAQKGLPREHPTIQREIYGRFVEDRSSLVFDFDESRNLFDENAHRDGTERRFFSIGVDLGFDDADAIVVWEWRAHDPTLRLVYEFKKSKLSLTELAKILTELQETYPNARKVIDTGGLGKKITEELIGRYKIHLEPAEKNRKLEYIELMNNDLRQGLIKLPKGSKLAEEWRLLQWDRDFNPPRVDDRFEDHLADAALYSFREARHYTAKPKKEVPRIDTNAHIGQYWERLAKERAKKQNANWWEK